MFSHVVSLPSSLFSSHRWTDFTLIGRSSVDGELYLCATAVNKPLIQIWRGNALIPRSWTAVTQFTPENPCSITSVSFSRDCRKMGMIITVRAVGWSAINQSCYFICVDLTNSEWRTRELDESVTFGMLLSVYDCALGWLLAARGRYDHSALGIVGRNCFCKIDLNEAEPSLQSFVLTPVGLDCHFTCVLERHIVALVNDGPNSKILVKNLLGDADWLELRPARPLPDVLRFCENENGQLMISDLESKIHVIRLFEDEKIYDFDFLSTTKKWMRHKSVYLNDSVLEMSTYGNCPLIMTHFFTQIRSLRFWASLALQKQFGNRQTVNIDGFRTVNAWSGGITPDDIGKTIGYRFKKNFV